MLIIDVSVNKGYVDQIYIQHTGRKEGELTIYKIVKPEGIRSEILHIRELGYKSLLKKALELILIHEKG